MTETAKVTVELAGGVAALAADARTFKSGSRGFFGHGKLRTSDGRRYQLSFTAVEIGSKPATGAPVVRERAAAP